MSEIVHAHVNGDCPNVPLCPLCVAEADEEEQEKKMNEYGVAKVIVEGPKIGDSRADDEAHEKLMLDLEIEMSQGMEAVAVNLREKFPHLTFTVTDLR